MKSKDTWVPGLGGREDVGASPKVGGSSVGGGVEEGSISDLANVRVLAMAMQPRPPGPAGLRSGAQEGGLRCR